MLLTLVRKGTRLQVLGLPVNTLPSAARVGPEFAEKKKKKHYSM